MEHGMIGHIVTVLEKATLSLPAIEITGLLIILTGCLVFRFSRTGLVFAYLFTYRWGMLCLPEHDTKAMVYYLVFGCIVGILTVIGMLHSPGR